MILYISGPPRLARNLFTIKTAIGIFAGLPGSDCGPSKAFKPSKIVTVIFLQVAHYAQHLLTFAYAEDIALVS